MRYLTARKRAEGKGAAHHGTEHHWYMTVSGAGLAPRASSATKGLPSLRKCFSALLRIS